MGETETKVEEMRRTVYTCKGCDWSGELKDATYENRDVRGMEGSHLLHIWKCPKCGLDLASYTENGE